MFCLEFSTSTFWLFLPFFMILCSSKCWVKLNVDFGTAPTDLSRVVVDVDVPRASFVLVESWEGRLWFEGETRKKSLAVTVRGIFMS